jgi:hypothetical protein
MTHIAGGSHPLDGSRGDTVTEFARAFRITYPDGFTLDGVRFPSGRCVVDCDCRDTPAVGTAADRLIEAATSFEHLTSIGPLAVVEWADGGPSPLPDAPDTEETP